MMFPKITERRALIETVNDELKIFAKSNFRLDPS